MYKKKNCVKKNKKNKNKKKTTTAWIVGLQWQKVVCDVFIGFVISLSYNIFMSFVDLLLNNVRQILEL